MSATDKKLMSMFEEQLEVLKTFQNEFSQGLNELRQGQGELQQRLNELQQGQAETNQRLDKLDADLNEVKADLHETKILIENETNRNIRILIDGFVIKGDRLDYIQPIVEKLEEDVSVVQSVILRHSKDINNLKAATG